MPEAPAALYNAAQYAAWFYAQVGKPYVLGANGPNAYDCSGLIIAGNNASSAHPQRDDTAAGMYNQTVAVKPGAEKVGDMVFLRNNPARSNGIGHIAVLTEKLSNGDWRIVEARGRASGVVKTTLSYWKTRRYFTGVRRFPNFHLAVAPKPDATVTEFWVEEFNCEDPRFGGHLDDDSGVLMNPTSSINLLVEAPEKVRDNIRHDMPGGPTVWKTWPRGDNYAQAAIFNSTAFDHTSSEPVEFGPTPYHGAVIMLATRVETGLRIQFSSGHLPPLKKGIATEAAQLKWFKKWIAALDPHLPTVIGGDFNNKKAYQWLTDAGFTVTPSVPTTDSGSHLDFVAVKNGGEILEVQIRNPRDASDHLASRVHIRFTTVPTN